MGHYRDVLFLCTLHNYVDLALVEVHDVHMYRRSPLSTRATIRKRLRKPAKDISFFSLNCCTYMVLSIFLCRNRAESGAVPVFNENSAPPPT